MSKSKSNIYTIVGILAYALSGIITCYQLSSIADNLMEKIVTSVLTVIMELGKIFFFKKVVDKDPVAGIFYATIAVWVILELVSISASTAYMLNKQAAIENKTVTNSTEYKNLESNKATIDGDIKTKEDELKSLKDSEKSDIQEIKAKYQPMINNAQNLRYLTTPEVGVTALTAKMEGKVKEVKDNIQAKENELAELKKQKIDINNTQSKVSTTTKVETVDGFNQFFKSISLGLSGAQGEDAAPINVSTIAFWFNFVAYGMVPEVIATLAFYYGAKAAVNTKSKTSKEDELFKERRQIMKNWIDRDNAASKKQEVKEKEQDETIDYDNLPEELTYEQYTKLPEHVKKEYQIENRKTIGFDTSSGNNGPMDNVDKFNVSDEVVEKYRAWMVNNPLSPGISKSYKVISDNIEIKRETGRMIKNILEERGEVKSIGNRTIILGPMK